VRSIQQRIYIPSSFVAEFRTSEQDADLVVVGYITDFVVLDRSLPAAVQSQAMQRQAR
jgi:hypothetical protein